MNECLPDIKTVCCTCLSINRKLTELRKINNGINNLYYLLSYDSEILREGFYKSSAYLCICWECLAIMNRLCLFREQACAAQKQLTNIAKGTAHTCLSTLSNYHINTYTHIFVVSDSLDNFIDCGPDIDYIKSESDTDDIPLSELQKYEVKNCSENLTDNFDNNELDTNYNNDSKPCKAFKSLSEKKVTKKRKKKTTSKYVLIEYKNKEHFVTTEMTKEEMLDSAKRRKFEAVFVEATSKCESCVKVFKDDIDYQKHKLDFHTQKSKHSQCDICLVYLRKSVLADHMADHYKRHTCVQCDHICYTILDIYLHLKDNHGIEIELPSKLKKELRKRSGVKNPGSKPRRNQALMDKRTPFGYSCTDCDQHFENKNKRYKHIQRYHREGFKCCTCGKRFAFKHNLTRHERLHAGPLPREQCPVCGKLVRCDLARVHAATHQSRCEFACDTCDKRFVSRASYDHHLKYTQAHATKDILKYKCSICEKGYRSRGELRDHVNYQHLGRTQHKCPICDKALATRRCITRHVRRAHRGLKESARDKICHTCGKAFRDKKGLSEHEARHSGARPLACGSCGRRFRQRAALYAHLRRVHRTAPAPPRRIEYHAPPGTDP